MSRANCALNADNPESGSAVLEFAFIAPVLMIMMFGLVEITNMLSFDRKVALAAQTMVDMIAREPDPAAADTDELGEVVELMIRPFVPTFSATVTVVNFDEDADPILSGADGPEQILVRGNAPFELGLIVQKADGLSVGNDQMIMGRVEATYEPILTVPFVSQLITMTSINTQRPRPAS